MPVTDDVCLLFSCREDTVYAKVLPEVDERELEKMVNPIVKEYFEHGDTKEVQVQAFKSFLLPLHTLLHVHNELDQ